MNKKNSKKRAKYEARQEQEAKNVIKWICWVMIILAVAYCAFSMFIVNG